MVDRNIPTNQLRTCAYCAMQIDALAQGTYWLAKGWCEVRSRGGPHLTMPESLGLWACRPCIQRIKAGIHPNQGSLFEQGD